MPVTLMSKFGEEPIKYEIAMPGQHFHHYKLMGEEVGWGLGIGAQERVTAE